MTNWPYETYLRLKKYGYVIDTRGGISIVLKGMIVVGRYHTFTEAVKGMAFHWAEDLALNT